jgi:excinuclease ABC subunit A
VTLARVGLGYIKVGQQATTLSGGEAQRIKLSKELSRKRDRPHALHSRRADDRPAFPRCRQAARSAARAGRAGQHVVVIEHNLEVIKTADWVLDLGPEGGDGGGEVVAQGTPEDVVRIGKGHTARFLKEVLERRPLKGKGAREAAE